MDTLISVKDAATRLSCSTAAIRKWIQQGKFQRVKVGRLTRIRTQDLDACIRLGLQPQETIDGTKEYADDIDEGLEENDRDIADQNESDEADPGYDEDNGQGAQEELKLRAKIQDMIRQGKTDDEIQAEMNKGEKQSCHSLS